MWMDIFTIFRQGLKIRICIVFFLCKQTVTVLWALSSRLSIRLRPEGYEILEASSKHYSNPDFTNTKALWKQILFEKLCPSVLHFFVEQLSNGKLYENLKDCVVLSHTFLKISCKKSIYIKSYWQFLLFVFSKEIAD